jgi:3'-phosphoadenosine 5'-phosphosulfate (PAPS) 3'-phosphatase
MAMVALGGTNANFEFGIHAWDIAAGYLTVTEAGGVVIDPAGEKYKFHYTYKKTSYKVTKAVIRYWPLTSSHLIKLYRRHGGKAPHILNPKPSKM